MKEIGIHIFILLGVDFLPEYMHVITVNLNVGYPSVQIIDQTYTIFPHLTQNKKEQCSMQNILAEFEDFMLKLLISSLQSVRHFELNILMECIYSCSWKTWKQKAQTKGTGLCLVHKVTKCLSSFCIHEGQCSC